MKEEKLFEKFPPVSTEQWEKKIKGWSRRKKEALIDNNWEKLKDYSVCQNSTHFSNFEGNKE